MSNLKIALSAVGLSAVMLFTACGQETEQETVDYVHSTFEGSTFSSTMFGITAKFDDDWTFLGDDDLAAMNGLTDMSEESAKSAFETSGIIYDMYVGNESGDNVGFIVEDLTYTNNASLDEQGYVDASYPVLKSQLEAQGFTVDNIEKTTFVFAGKETPCVKIEISLLGSSFCEYQVYKKAGQYMGVITATASDMDLAEELIGKFSSL